MAFPAGLTLVVVTCQFDELPDGGAYGSVRIAYDGPLTGPTDNSIVPSVDVSAALSSAGTCTIAVPATNDPDWTPQDFSYTVTARIGPAVRRGTLQLDYQTAEVNLADLIQWDGAVEAGVTYATLAQLTAAQAAAAALVDDLSGVTDAATARDNLGLGDAATLDVGTTAGTVAAGDDARITGALQTTGGTVGGELVVDGDVLRVDGPAETFRQVQLSTDDSVRWSIHANNTAESGAGAGSDWRLVRYDDDGVALDAPIGVSRATGAITLAAALTVAGDVAVTDAAGDKAYRLRASGSALDFDAAGTDLFLSAFPNADFSGTQRNYLRLESGAQLAHALGRWLFADGAFTGTGVADLDPSTGLATLGAKNGLAGIPFAGRRTAAGPPTAGTWAAGDLVQAADGFWQCVTAGEPGAWLLIAAAPSTATPDDHGLVGWTFDPALVQGGAALDTSGLAYVARVRAMSSVVTNICFHFTAGGTDLTGAYAALYNDAGALLGAGAVTADHSGSWESAGFKTCPLTVAQGVTPGAFYRAYWWFTGAAGPTQSRAADASSAVVNAGMSSGYRYATADAELETTPPGNIGSMTGGDTAWWVGLS